MNEKREKVKTDLWFLYNGQAWELKVSPFILGRDPKVCDLVINNKKVSRKHAQLTFWQNCWYVEDLNSSSGTMLNGIKADPGRKLEVVAGDDLELADAMLLFQSEKEKEAIKADEEISTSEKLFKEIEQVKSQLREFVDKNKIDQEGFNQLSRLTETVRQFSGEDALLYQTVQETLGEVIQTSKRVQVYGRAPQKEKKPVFHPVKVDGDWADISVSKIPFTIGRGPDNVDFVLKATGISRSHCLVSFQDGVYQINDLASTNGVFLNKIPLKPNQNYPIKNGDNISFGTNQFYVEI